jgi:UDP-2-acetamido-2-deoxy-ribo-hexuluronate aminotransferase
MQAIQMVDLYNQYLRLKSDIDKSISEVLSGTAFINGPHVKQFKSELESYLKCKHVIPVANGTDALQIALMALDLKSGDEVIVPDFTFIATAEVIALLNLKPVLVDVDPDTFNIVPEKIRKAITKRTKVIIPVHLYGQTADMNEIMSIAEQNSIYVVEDNAQAIGASADYRGAMLKAGTIGHIGCTSFFPSKNLGCYGDGGAIFTNDDKLAENMACIANHGAKVKYYHDIVGVNSRLDTLQAAILSVKLKNLDQFISERKKAAEYYDQMLESIEQIQIPKRASYSEHVFHQYTLKAERRDELKDFLASKKIPTMIYYPVGMHNQKAYKSSGDFKVSDALCKAVISLPMHTELSEEQQNYIVESIKEFYK